MASMVLVAGLQVAGTPAYAVPPGQAGGDDTVTEVEPEVRDALTSGGTTDFWVYLRQEAELGAAASITDRGAQGEHVIEQLTTTAERSQAALRRMLDAEGVPYQPFWITNAVKVTGDADLLRRIEALPEVAQVTTDRVYELPEPAPAEEQVQVDSVEWGVDRINAPEVWDTFGATGEGVVVGTIDSGAIYTHPALVNQYRGNLGDGQFDHNYQWHDPSSVCGAPSLAPCDNSGHGTHVVGTIVGDDGGDNRIGVAPDAQWIAAKGCESSSCSQAALLSSGQFMLAPTDLDGHNPRPDLRPHIVNNSWGGGATTDPWYQPTVEAWVAAGIFPQFANGNWNNPGNAPCGTSSNPGNLPDSYSAGAFDIDNEIARFSHRGPSAFDSDLIKPNIAAPGVAVRSAWLNHGYSARSGTSMASPHVAGTVALMWSAALALERDIDATRQLLDQTALGVEDLSCGGTAGNNNVWGQGALDAYAAVDAAPRGPVGTLTGTVTDAQTDEPVSPATVSVTGEVDRDELTGPDGSYTVRLPAGEYDLEVSAFGFETGTLSVTVVADETTTADVELSPVASVTVSGEVADGSGHGWPLHSWVEVLDTPVTTYTDPMTGQYQLQLPAGSNFQLRFTPEYPGYETVTTTVSTGTGDVTADAAPQVENCNAAPGYEFSGDVAVLDASSHRFAPYLEDQGIPVDRLVWGDDPTPYDVLIINAPGFRTGQPLLEVLDATDDSGTSILFLDSQSNGTGIWMLNNNLGIPSSRTNGFSAAIPYLFYEVVAEHPILDGFEIGDEIVFDETSNRKDFAWFDGYEGEGRQVIAHAGRGDTGAMGPGIGVQERDNNRHALLSMHADAGFSNTDRWTADGELLFWNALRWLAPDAEFECVQTDGGLVLGHITDENTGSGVTGARVTTTTAPEPATSFAPVDPAVDRGFFWLFSGEGEQQLTVTADRYVEVEQTVDVAASGVVRADASLPAGQLQIEPGELSAEQRIGRSTDRTFTVTNTGTGPAEVELEERRDSFEILGGGAGPAAPGAEIQYVEGEFSPAARPSGDAGPSSAPQQVGPMAEPWRDLPIYPVSVMDNTTEVVDGRLFSFGGYTGTRVLSDTYMYSPQSGRWSPAADLPAPRQQAEAVAVDGLIYLFGGWDGDWGPTATTLIYNPEDNSWSQGADMPDARAAVGATVLDGKVYIVGGCTTSDCTPMANNLWRYDPGADEWESLATYPRFSAFHACAGLERMVFCAGGTNGPDSYVATFAYDPVTDSWSQKANLPYDNWGMGYAAAGGQFVVTGGIAFGGAVTNRSASYSPSEDMWVDIEPANVPVYRGGGACGFYRVGGSLTGFTPVSHGEQHPDYRDCVLEVDVAWMSADTATATLQPGESVTVTVSLDAGEVDQPGDYTAGIGLHHDTPYDVAPVNVSMSVEPPNNWGKITGTVFGVDCFGGSTPMAFAAVQIEGRHDQVQLFTDEDGGYAYWLANNNGQLDVTVSANGYLAEQVRSNVRPGSVTVENFHLAPIC